MAISFLDTPYDCSRVGQRLIFLASSDQVAQSGFRYCFEVEVYGGIGQGNYYFIRPNFNDVGVFDISPILFELLYPIDDAQVHYSSESFYVDQTINRNIAVRCYEGYLVDGVFTIDKGSEKFWKGCVYRGAFQFRDGYKPNPDTYLNHHSLVDTNSLFNSAIKVGTFPCPPELYTAGQSIGLDPNSDVIVPSYPMDFGCMYVHQSDSVCNLGLSAMSPYPLILINSYDEQGNLLQESRVNQWFVNREPEPCNSLAFPFYYRNVVEGGLIPDGTYFYTVVNFDDVQEYQSSARYVVYNKSLCSKTKSKTRYGNIRVGWYNKYGGVDYFTFDKGKTFTNSFERKRYKRVSGNYSSAGGEEGFYFNPSDRGMQETRVQSGLTIELQSDWISEGEFRYLNEIRDSHFVFILFSEDYSLDNYGCELGQITPVVVEDSSYNIQQIRTGQKYNQKLTLRLAQDNWTA
jgi:hypothetical protein